VGEIQFGFHSLPWSVWTRSKSDSALKDNCRIITFIQQQLPQSSQRGHAVRGFHSKTQLYCVRAEQAAHELKWLVCLRVSRTSTAWDKKTSARLHSHSLHKSAVPFRVWLSGGYGSALARLRSAAPAGRGLWHLLEEAHCNRQMTRWSPIIYTSRITGVWMCISSRMRPLFWTWMLW